VRQDMENEKTDKAGKGRKRAEKGA